MRVIPHDVYDTNTRVYILNKLAAVSNACVKCVWELYLYELKALVPLMFNVLAKTKAPVKFPECSTKQSSRTRVRAEGDWAGPPPLLLGNPAPVLNDAAWDVPECRTGRGGERV